MNIKIILHLLVYALLIGNVNAQTKDTIKMEQAADEIFNAWQKGEAGDGYAVFTTLVDEEGFNHFSHPLTGNFKRAEGYKNLFSLIAAREAMPNKLKFSNIIRYSSGNNFCFQFDSEGTVSGGYPYKGYNIIQLQVKAKKLVGFREYFGFIDAAWFK